jgi:predicted permease
MNTSCSSCEASFEPEPGFYFGAMYVSYGFTILLFIFMWAVLRFFFNPSDQVYFVAIVATATVSTPLSFRYSRILFLYWFGGLGRKER